jgi:hypothetical protein
MRVTWSPESAWLFEITLAWDANTEPDLAGYRIYQGNGPGEYGAWKAQVKCRGSDTTCTEITLVVPAPGKYYWVATAYDDAGNESARSEEITHTFYSAPVRPQGLRKK